MVDAARLGAWLRPGKGTGWLAAGTMPNSLYRMPVVYLFLACVFCYSCSFLFAVFVCVFLLLLLLFLTFSALLVVNPKKLLYTVANPARGLLNRKKKKKKKVLQRSPPPARAARSDKKKKKKKRKKKEITRRIHISRRYASLRYAGGLGPSRIRTRIPTTRQLVPMGVASQNSTLPCAIATFPVSLPLSSPGDVWPRLPLLASTRP